MSSQLALRNADLAKALEELKNEVRREPAVAKHRVFMFQLASVMGDWDRALTQLNVARDMNAECLSLAQTYQELINCEALRRDVFAGTRAPLFFGEPEPWIAMLLDATRLSGLGKHAEAAKLRGEALEQVSPSAGKAFLHAAPGGKGAEAAAADADLGTPFEWIADADSRLGPILEAVINGRYYWIPFSRMRRVDFEKPADLRDFVWLPAHFEWTNGGEVVGFVPSRYPESESSTDDLIRLARKTEWKSVGDDAYHGLGLRTLSTEEAEYSLFELRRLEIDEAAAGA